MMSKKVKKMFCGLMAGLCVAGNTVPVMADTVRFDVTVPGDPKTKRTVKADGEQKFYVTGTYFSTYASLSCRSYQLDNQHIFSKYAYISKNDPASNAKYEKWAASGVYYFMITNSSATGLNVEGRYTP